MPNFWEDAKLLVPPQLRYLFRIANIDQWSHEGPSGHKCQKLTLKFWYLGPKVNFCQQGIALQRPGIQLSRWTQEKFPFPRYGSFTEAHPEFWPFFGTDTTEVQIQLKNVPLARVGPKRYILVKKSIFLPWSPNFVNSTFVALCIRAITHHNISFCFWARAIWARELFFFWKSLPSPYAVTAGIINQLSHQWPIGAICAPLPGLS